jgi:hypothetical protein
MKHALDTLASPGAIVAIMTIAWQLPVTQTPVRVLKNMAKRVVNF